jgi:hypothetical protein
MDVSFEFSGFVNDIAYTANCSAFLQTYADKFPDVEKLHLVVTETPYMMLGNPRPSSVVYNEEGTVLTVTTSTNKSYDRKGSVTGMPDVESVFRGIMFLLDKTAEAHKKN